jgi:hypothetical protein
VVKRVFIEIRDNGVVDIEEGTFPVFALPQRLFRPLPLRDIDEGDDGAEGSRKWTLLSRPILAGNKLSFETRLSTLIILLFTKPTTGGAGGLQAAEHAGHSSFSMLFQFFAPLTARQHFIRQPARIPWPAFDIPDSGAAARGYRTVDTVRCPLLPPKRLGNLSGIPLHISATATTAR